MIFKQEMWVLTEQEIKDELDIDLNLFLGDISKINPLLLEISRDIYDYALEQTLIENGPSLIKGLNTIPEKTELLKKALLSQVRFAVRSRGGHLLKDQMLVNVSTGLVLGDDVFTRAISEQAKTYLRRTNLLKTVRYELQ